MAAVLKHLVYQMLAFYLYFQNIGEVRVGPWGGKDGTEFQYQIKDGEHIIGFYISANPVCVYALSLVVAPSRRSVPLFGDVGERLGGKSDMAIFQDDEYITGFNGTYATNQAGRTYITSLSFITNKQTYGPTGIPSGTPFLTPMFQGKFVGYFGWFSDGLSSIGAIFKPDQPDQSDH